MALAGFCLDTDILIDYLRGIEDAKLFLLETSARSPLFISVISIAEIYSGSSTKNRKMQQEIQKFLSNFNTIQLTPTLAQKGGALQRDFQIPFADALIAASAIAHHATIVTRNVKHFKRVKRLKVKIPY